MTDVASVMSYPKVWTMGARCTARLFEGPVCVQEKVDGSQFRFGLNDKGELLMGSHHQTLYAPEGMFAQAWEYVHGLGQEWMNNNFETSTWFFCEYLSKPKHNTLAYGHAPTHGLVLFDVWVGEFHKEGHWATTPERNAIAGQLGIDAVPVLHEGPLTLAEAQALLTRESYLGGQIIEGIVIKNYAENVLVGGELWPLFAKIVRAEYQETHRTEWKSGKGKENVEAFIESFCTEARWQKAVQHLDEQGLLVHDVQDIGPLIREIGRDVTEEETDNIKDALYRLYIKDIVRAASRGLPEWWKTHLRNTP